MLELRHVGRSFGAVQALADVDLALRPGAVHALVGENGAGKSTLIRLASGVLAPDAGEILLDGLPVALTPRHAMAAGITVVHQQPALLDTLSVTENLSLHCDGRWIDWRARRQRARELLALVGGGIDPEAPVGSLAPAARQLVQIARALGEQPRYLVLDEPTAVLPHRDATRLLAHLRDLRARGVAVLYVSHRLEEIEQLADQVTVLRDGRVAWSGPMREVTRDALIRHMVGRAPVATARRAASEAGPVVLAVERLASDGCGLRDVTLSLRAGEILGLAGLVGAGRTELAECLFGLRPIDGGSLRLDGAPFAPADPRAAFAAGVVLVPEDRRAHGVIAEMSVADNVTLPRLHAVTGSTGLVDARREDAAAGAAVAALRIKTASVRSPVATLSGGNQQKVVLARWLAPNPGVKGLPGVRGPRVLILDEPTQGIDVGAREQIHRLIQEQARAGVAVLLVSSDLTEILVLADRVAVMRAGRIAGTLAREQATEERVLALALGAPDAAASEPAAPPTTATPAPIGRRPSRTLALGALLAALLATLWVLAPGFFSPGNLLNLAVDAAPVLVAAAGMTLVILAGQIDVSIGAQLAVCGVAAGVLARLGTPMPLVALATLLAGVALGLANGALVAFLRVPALVATLATLAVFRGALRWLTGGQWIQDLPPGFRWLGLGQAAAQPVWVAVAVALFALVALFVHQTRAGRQVPATGCDAEIARWLGARPDRVRLGVFATMGGLAAGAALLNATRYPAVEIEGGLGLELEVIACVVVGGASIRGGRGTFAGTALGVAFFTVLGAALTFLRVDAAWEKAVHGVVLLAAVVADARRGAGDGGRTHA